MKVGLVYPQVELRCDPQAVHDIGVGAEQLGFDSLLVYDHVVGAEHDDREPPLRGPHTERDPFHEPLVMFGYLAAVTSRIELATGVMILPQRQTALVAQQAADADLFSRQRVRLGVGTGWNYVEYERLGQDLATRVNGGILFDTWHFFRGSADFDDLEAVPGERILAVQVDDAATDVSGSLWDDTQPRLLPGDGCFDLPRVLRTLAHIDGLRFVGPEVVSPETAAMPAVDAAPVAGERVRALVADALEQEGVPG